MLRNKCVPFSGSFTEDCQDNSVPQSLLMLVTMIMYGTNIKNNASYLSQPALSLSQLMMYNSCVRRRQQPSSNTRHFEQRETPLPLFIGALAHSRTRSKDLVDTLYRLGLSVSYDRCLEAANGRVTKICRHSQLEQFALLHSTLVCSRHQQWIILAMTQQQLVHMDPSTGQAFHYSSIPTLRIVEQSKQAGFYLQVWQESHKTTIRQPHTCTGSHCHKARASCSRTF